MLRSAVVLVVHAPAVQEASVRGPLLVVIVVGLLLAGVVGGYLLRRSRMR